MYHLRQEDIDPARPAFPAVQSAQDLLLAARRPAANGLAQIDVSGLDRVLHRNRSRDLVEVQARTRWATLAQAIDSGLLGLARDPDLPETVGATVAQNSRMPDGSAIVGCLESITIVTPDGELRRLNRGNNRELFFHVIGGQDVFGIPYSLTLRECELRRHSIPTGAQVESGKPHTTGVEDFRIIVPIAWAGEVSREIRALLDHWRVDVVSIRERPIACDSQSVLHWICTDPMQVTTSFHRPERFGSSVRIEQLRRQLVDLALACNGSFPIGTCTSATRAQALACYPMLSAFLAEKRRLDPRNRLLNPWYLHYRNLVARSF